MRSVLAYDLGGTKLAAAVVDDAGKILDLIKVATHLSEGPDGLIQSLIAVGKNLISKHQVRSVGLSSAGPLDPVKGVLLNPTNFTTDGQKWGEVDLVSPLAKSFGLPVLLENDAAAAAVGELWMGEHQGVSSLSVMTLGTGVGIGTVVEGKLVRGRGGIHPDFSHTYLNFDDSLAPCGCGSYGCIEAYLGGVNFPRYFSRKTGGPLLSGQELVTQAQQKDPYACEAFDCYADLMARAVQNLVVTYGVSRVIYSGSFSHAFPFFIEKTLSTLQVLLKDRRVGFDFMPELKLSQIQETAGLVGAAKMALLLPSRM